MTNKTVIQVFVSCPSDVEDQKEIVISVSKALSLNDDASDVILQVKNWKDFIGKSGERVQEQINKYIGEYDIYLGILWKRFGTPPGSTNPLTGQKIESGTEEEFLIALERSRTPNSPDIHFFIRKDNRTSNTTEENGQLGKVLKFIEGLQKTNVDFINEFEKGEFYDKIVTLLNRKQLIVSEQSKINQKKNLLEEKPTLDLNQFRTPTPPPKGYISRLLIHYNSFIEKKQSPLLEIKKEKLQDLIISKKRIVVLGDAGSGKSTEVKYLQFLLSERDAPFLPIFKQLNTYTIQDGIEKFLSINWKEIPENLLLIILDGLDEIQPHDFNTAVRQINNFSENHPDLRIVISSRTNFYELPSAQGSGTLKDFEPYFISDLGVHNAELYYTENFGKANSREFALAILRENFDDLVRRPFFLMSLASIYSKKQKLPSDRSKLLEDYISSRIDTDQRHYKGTLELEEKEEQVFQLIEKVALSMEILARNTITKKELLKIVNKEEIDLLKYSTAFKANEEEQNIWQFEHNNIQEYLAAKALSKLSFQKLIRFITFEKEHKKLIPSWVNTLTFLFSLIDKKSKLYSSLLSWLVKNEKEVIIKFERDKIDEATRVKLFKEIFNYYKEHNIWVSSNKFRDKDFARFGQSKDGIKFLVSEIEKKSNTRTVKLNAIRIIEYFEVDKEKQKIKEALLRAINDNKEDSYFVYEVINTLVGINISDKVTLKRLMNLFEKRNNQYIRTSMYSMIEKLDAADKHIDYLISGLKLLRKEVSEDRENTHLFGEDLSLFGCINSIKSPNSFIKLIQYFKSSHFFDYSYEREERFNKIVETATTLFSDYDIIFKEMLSWFIDRNRSLENKFSSAMFTFFEKTHTQKRGFMELLKEFDVKDYNTGVALAKFANEELLTLVIEKYKNRDITNDDIQRFYYDLRGFRNDNLFEIYEELLKNQTGYKIIKPPVIDHEKIRIQRQQEDFDLLFDIEKFEKEILFIFSNEGKEEFTQDELYDVRKSRFSNQDWEDYYLDTPLNILRDISNVGKSVSKERVKIWLSDVKKVKWYCITEIYNHLIRSNKEIVIKPEQNKFLTDWTQKEALTFNFKTAIYLDGQGIINYSYTAIFISHFTVLLNIEHPKNVLLDMLSIDYLRKENTEEENAKKLNIDFIAERLHKKDVSKRIVSNIRDGIIEDGVLTNHLKYAIENGLTEAYEFIKKEIINNTRDKYTRRDILKLYSKGTNDKNGIKRLYHKADLFIKWEIIEILITANEYPVASKYLIELLNEQEDIAEKLRAAELLISISNAEGLNFLLKWLLESNETNIPTHNKFNLNKLNSPILVPQLVELLELSYKRKIMIENFYELRGVILEVLSEIGILSDDNFNLIKNTLEKFIKGNQNKYEHVNYILFTIEKIETNFYMNKAQTYTIEQVVEKMKELN